jgi:hypothetical protein
MTLLNIPGKWYILAFIVGASIATATCLKVIKTTPEVINNTQTVHDTVTVTRVIKDPNGKVTTEYITEVKVEEKVVTVPVKKNYKVGVGSRLDYTNKDLIYNLTVGKYITKDISLNLTIDTEKQVGIGVDISF